VVFRRRRRRRNGGGADGLCRLAGAASIAAARCGAVHCGGAERGTSGELVVRMMGRETRSSGRQLQQLLQLHADCCVELVSSSCWCRVVLTRSLTRYKPCRRAYTLHMLLILRLRVQPFN